MLQCTVPKHHPAFAQKDIFASQFLVCKQGAANAPCVFVHQLTFGSLTETELTFFGDGPCSNKNHCFFCTCVRTIGDQATSQTCFGKLIIFDQCSILHAETQHVHWNSFWQNSQGKTNRTKHQSDINH